MGDGSFSVVNPPPPIARIRRIFPRLLWTGARFVDDLRAKADWPFLATPCLSVIGGTRPIADGRVVEIPTAGIRVERPYRAFTYGLVFGDFRHPGVLACTSAMCGIADGGAIEQPDGSLLHH